MGGNYKENILIELRQYHLDEFPGALSSSELNELRKEFAEIEDEVVNSALSIINGKIEYQNQDKLLDEFLNRVKSAAGSEHKADLDFFRAKIDHLKVILGKAQQGGFPLRKQRPARASKSTKQIIEEK